MEKGRVYFITGLSGAGKSTVARELFKIIRSGKSNVILLDGDELREIFLNDLGYSMEDRKKMAMRYVRLVKMLSDQNIDVILATISMFSEVRQWNRKHIENYVEIYIKASLDTLVKRDPKGIYKNALNGSVKNVLGIDLEFEEPDNPDMVLENDSGKSCESLARKIFERFGIKAVLPGQTYLT